MKGRRQDAILELIEEFDIETQEELASKLKENGFKVTQATISRDIKELHLIKSQSDSGAYKYAVNENKNMVNTDRLMKVFQHSVLSISRAMNLVVVQTLSGSANAAAETIDKLELTGVVGTIAGDNTIFIAASSEGAAEMIINKLKQLCSK